MSAFQNYFVDTIKQRYAQFDGRASRSEYWFFQLFTIVVLLVLSTISGVIGNFAPKLALLPLGLMLIMGLAVMIPGLALTVRRLHDSDKSGWLILVGFIPAVGWIISLVFMCLESTPGTNQYGPNPHETDVIGGSQSFNDIIDR